MIRWDPTRELRSVTLRDGRVIQWRPPVAHWFDVMGGLALGPRTFWQPVRGRRWPWATVRWADGRRLYLVTHFRTDGGGDVEATATGATIVEAVRGLLRIHAAYQ